MLMSVSQWRKREACEKPRLTNYTRPHAPHGRRRSSQLDEVDGGLVSTKPGTGIDPVRWSEP